MIGGAVAVLARRRAGMRHGLDYDVPSQDNTKCSQVTGND